MKTIEDYQRLLIQLQPKGKFWNRDLLSTISKFWLGVAAEFVRIEGRELDLFHESLIKSTSELIEDHEEDYGIIATGTTAERLKLLLAKKLAVGENHDDYFIEKAAALGLTITIDVDNPSWVGIVKMGDPICDQETVYKWIVYVDLSGDCGGFSTGFNPNGFNSLAPNNHRFYYTHDTQNIKTLIDEFTKFKPAHTKPYYTFSGRGFSSGFSFGFNAIPWYDGTCPPGGFNRGFSNGFHNIRDYDGAVLTGGLAKGFSIGFNRHSGGGFTNGFTQGYNRPN